ncbi:hypothetical protein ACLQ3B_22370 [Micromonospora sp. DT53]|uniref:hypothetical protein n=1 Tax=Micromonospora sp. DT53 TaxID=3393444 RepID=UPI003CEBAD0F
MNQAIGIRTPPAGTGPLWRAIIVRARRRPAAAAAVDYPKLWRTLRVPKEHPE